MSTSRCGSILLGVCVLSGAMVRDFAQGGKNPKIQSPNGLVVVLPPGKQKERLEIRAVKNPFISGVAVQINWRDLEPMQGQPDWSRLDSVFAAAEQEKKWVQLLIFPGFFAPDWAKKGAETDQFPIQYGPGKGTIESLPMPWDRVYLHSWFAFLKLLSQRYGSSPAFRMIAAAGPTSVSAEMTLPNKPKDLKKWIQHSYTVEKYLGAWREVFQFYAACFPKQCVSLSEPRLPLALGPRGKDPGKRLQAWTEIVDLAASILGNRLAIQWSGLRAGHVAVGPPDQTDFVRSYSGRIITGLQMGRGAEGDSAAMGAEGDPPLALRRSIDKGMKPNHAGKCVNYLEIHEKDVLAEEMQPVLKYAASLFSQKQPLKP